ncbi:hypothetical protein [Streptomyces sp. NPDC001450]
MTDNMVKGQQTDLSSLMERAAQRASTIPFEGYSREDRNIPGNILIVESENCVYSFANSDIMDREQLGDDRIRIWVREGATAFRLARIRTGEPDPFTVAVERGADPAPTGLAVSAEQMEHIPPPPAVELPGAPRSADGIAPAGAAVRALPLMASVGSQWTNSCLGGDAYANNCAHFLSDAFIRAGYTELAVANPFVNARCNTSARRPIRARDMWAWFQSKAVRTSSVLSPNTGWWAVFQLNEAVYWGGHVALLDSNAWIYYGTGWYGSWNQYLYQW